MWTAALTRSTRRFDEMRDLWGSQLHRVEEVLDARLKHLEERADAALPCAKPGTGQPAC